MNAIAIAAGTAGSIQLAMVPIVAFNTALEVMALPARIVFGSAQVLAGMLAPPRPADSPATLSFRNEEDEELAALQAEHFGRSGDLREAMMAALN